MLAAQTAATFKGLGELHGGVEPLACRLVQQHSEDDIDGELLDDVDGESLDDIDGEELDDVDGEQLDESDAGAINDGC